MALAVPESPREENKDDPGVYLMDTAILIFAATNQLILTSVRPPVPITDTPYARLLLSTVCSLFVMCWTCMVVAEVHDGYGILVVFRQLHVAVRYLSVELPIHVQSRLLSCTSRYQDLQHTDQPMCNTCRKFLILDSL